MEIAKSKVCDIIEKNNCKGKKEKMKEWWDNNGEKIVGVGILIFTALVVLGGGKVPEDIPNIQKKPEEEEDEFLCQNVYSFPKGEKYWNPNTQNWEKDGEAYIYRVTWTDKETGSVYSKDYTDIDTGFDFYNSWSKNPYVKDIEWDHIAPEDKDK